jgi:hypothetical protein
MVLHLHGGSNMKFIAHRGLTRGPNKSLENQPQQIRSALEQGYDCEVDLWVFGDRFYLGHDGPQYNVTEEFVNTPGFWIHAKSLETLHWLVTKGNHLTFFTHEKDPQTITSNHYIWTYPGERLTDRSIQLMPEWNDPKLENVDFNCYAICSDFVDHLKSIAPSGRS